MYENGLKNPVEADNLTKIKVTYLSTISQIITIYVSNLDFLAVVVGIDYMQKSLSRRHIEKRHPCRFFASDNMRCVN